MKIRIDPVGEGRVVYFNSGDLNSGDLDSGDLDSGDLNSGDLESGGPASSRDEPLEIVLIRPNETVSSDFFSGKFWENLGVLTLASCLEEAGICFGVLEASLFQCTPRQTAELATERRPRFVGISVFSTDLLETCLDLATRIEEADPNVVIVLGGHGASFVHREILEDNPAVDVVVRGEGEHALLELLRSEPTCWSTIANISWRAPDGEIATTPTRKVNDNLDEVPLPHRFGRSLMASDEVLARSPLMIVSSRGCFDRCSFCTVTKFYNGSWRGRSPVHVVDELEEMVERYGRPSVHFWDDTFLGPGQMGRRRALQIAEEMQRRKLELTFHITTRPSDLREDVVAALAAAGLRSIFLGVESSEQSTLDYFDKHAKVEHSDTAIEMLWRHGVHRILIGFILFHPRTTWRSFRRDLEYMGRFPNVEIMRVASRLAFHPGSRFWLENRDELGAEAYKKSYVPALASPGLEQMYAVCLRFYAHTVNIEQLIVCLEEQYLHDRDAIDLLAQGRARVFGAISERARQVSLELEAGCEPSAVPRYCDEIFMETMKTLDFLQQRLGDEYFGLLQKAYRLEGYERFLPIGAGDAAAC